MSKKKSKVVVKSKIKKSEPVYKTRINRIYGQVGGVKKMIEEEKNSVEILTQLKAARAAIKALEAEILEEYLKSSALDLSGSSAVQKAKKISDLKKIFLRFE